MRTKYISNSLSANYSEPIAPVKTLPPVKKKGGRDYTLIGISGKNYSLLERIRIGGSAFGKTSLSLGGALLSKNVRDNWKTCWNGKRSVAVYSSANRHYRELSDSDRTVLTSFFKGSKFKVEDFKDPIADITCQLVESDELPSQVSEPLFTLVFAEDYCFKQILIPIYEKTPGGWKPSVFLMMKNTTLDSDWECMTHRSFLASEPRNPDIQTFQDLMSGQNVTINNCEYKLR